MWGGWFYTYYIRLYNWNVENEQPQKNSTRCLKCCSRKSIFKLENLISTPFIWSDLHSRGWGINPPPQKRHPIFHAKLLPLKSANCSSPCLGKPPFSPAPCNPPYILQSFPYENQCECYKKLAWRSWPVLSTLTDFFFIHTFA